MTSDHHTIGEKVDVVLVDLILEGVKGLLGGRGESGLLQEIFGTLSGQAGNEERVGIEGTEVRKERFVFVLHLQKRSTVYRINSGWDRDEQSIQSFSR